MHLQQVDYSLVVIILLIAQFISQIHQEELTQHKKTPANLDPVRSKFNGRVYLRQDYSTNTIFDDISDSFTGIGATFQLKLVEQALQEYKQEVQYYY